MQLMCVLSAAYLIAAALFSMLELPLWGKAAMMLIMAVILALQSRRFAFLASPNSIVALEFDSENALNFQKRDGTRHACQVMATSFVSPYLTLLNLKSAETGARCHLVILPDSLEKEDFRRLRIWLRWKHT
jgi:toxin CptA